MYTLNLGVGGAMIALSLSSWFLVLGEFFFIYLVVGVRSVTCCEALDIFRCYGLLGVMVQCYAGLASRVHGKCISHDILLLDI
uniref:Uncharacterized protein n=1 Tax=Lactuca sativa TaxID=4236 RepID=A0A9R1XID1_LACSA|nr:hypothetical protein LSAT_V11C400217590 [Lactuca sativa]